MAADDYGVIVGIRDYPQLLPLAGPVADACAFYEWLVSPEGGDVPPEHACKVLSPPEPAPDPMRAPPMLGDVQVELDRLQQIGFEHDGRAGRRLWLYLAGHGVAPTAGDAALLMANADRNRLYHLPAAPYLNWFRTAAMFDEVVVIADCCREYVGGGHLPPFYLPWSEMASPGADVHYFTAFATKWSRVAREKPVDGNGEVRGLFTRALIEGLKHGRGTPKLLESYVHQRLPELCDPNEFQVPVFDYDIDLTLAATVAPKPCTLRIAFAADDPAVTVAVLDGKFAELESFAMSGGSRDVPVDAGLYAVRRSDQRDDPKLVSVTKGVEDVVV
jgi:hypothetical protein